MLLKGLMVGRAASSKRASLSALTAPAGTRVGVLELQVYSNSMYLRGAPQGCASTTDVPDFKLWGFSVLSDLLMF